MNRSRPVFAGDALKREMTEAALSFDYFLFRHTFIADRTSQDGAPGVIQWEHWPIHDEMCEDQRSATRLIILKARQIGASWFWAAVHVWGAMFTPNYLGGVISAGQVESTEFLSKCRTILNNLPYATLPTLEQDNSEVMRFTATKGTIMAFPSTTKAGRGFTFSRMVVDEAAFHEHAAENYAAYEPALAEGGQIVVLSSAGDGDRSVVTDWFQQMWTGGRDGANGFRARFYPRTARPGRDAGWEERTRRRYASNPDQFDREYPDTPSAAFRSMVRLRFGADAVTAALERCRPPLAAVPGLPEGVALPHLRVWSAPRAGVPYVAYTDAAEAKGRDFTVTMWFEARTLKHVATLRENQLEPTQHGAMADKLSRWYNTALWGVERNRGEAILYAAGQANYPRLYWHDDSTLITAEQRIQYGQREPRRRLGLPVTGQTRPALIDDLAEAIVTGALDSDDDVFWGECGRFVVTEQGRPEAAPGAHDDLVLCAAGAVRMSRQPGAQTMASTGQALARERGRGWRW